jgi:hypothetical protein
LVLGLLQARQDERHARAFEEGGRRH